VIMPECIASPRLPRSTSGWLMCSTRRSFNFAVLPLAGSTGRPLGRRAMHVAGLGLFLSPG
jgi:hypothetical protein